MLNRLNKNIGELKSNIEGIKSIVNNKKKTYEIEGIKTINKHVELDDKNTIEIAIDANISFDDEGREIILESNNINKIAEDIVSTVLENTKGKMLMPKSILISSKEDLVEKLDYVDLNREYSNINLDIIDIQKPKYNLEKVVLNKNLKHSVSRILAISKNKSKIVNDLKIQNSLKSKNAILCNFYGESGNGKNCIIDVIANEINKNILTLNYNRLESIQTHNIPRFIKSVFEIAKKQDAIVVIQEADRLIKENDINYSGYNNIINIVKSCIKAEIKNFDSMLFFTSNIKEKVDRYFSRLFFINVEFENPDYYEREELWKLYIGEEVKLSPILGAKSLAQKYDDVTRGEMRDILFIAGSIALEENRDILYEIDFDLAYKQVLNRY